MGVLREKKCVWIEPPFFLIIKCCLRDALYKSYLPSTQAAQLEHDYDDDRLLGGG